MKQILPAILSNSVADFREKIEKCKKCAKKLHVDIMDGVFVKNKTIQSKSLRGLSRFYISVHLMAFNPENYIEELSEKNVDELIFHYEATENHKEVIKRIRETPMKVGLAISPETSVQQIRKLLPLVDLVLVMTVHPGAGGQEMIEVCLRKIKQIKRFSQKMIVGIDGGVNPESSRAFKKLHLDFVVAGWVLKGTSVKKRMEELSRFIG